MPLIAPSPSSSTTRGEARHWKDQWDHVYVVTVQATKLSSLVAKGDLLKGERPLTLG